MHIFWQMTIVHQISAIVLRLVAIHHAEEEKLADLVIVISYSVCGVLMEVSNLRHSMCDLI